MPQMIFVDEESEGEEGIALFRQRQPPQDSLHWQMLNHQPGDGLLTDQVSLLRSFGNDLGRIDADLSETVNHDTRDWHYNLVLATWSCIFGYCEALATHKDPLRRFDLFPVPIDALRRLVQEEFVPLIKSAVEMLPDATVRSTITKTNDNILSIQRVQNQHRERVQGISNAIWQNTLPKANIKDELHANSVYICLRGKAVDKKSLDCFGAAVTTIAALLILGNDSQQEEYRVQSYLTLSEDHAYERHEVVSKVVDNQHDNVSIVTGTCEVAIPGTTNLAKSKRGREISFTLENNNDAGDDKPNQRIVPENSWLYMAKNPVVCKTLPMALVAIVGNMNPTIEMPSSANKPILASGQLYDMKRDLLWILYDRGHMKEFPFGILELGDCEEHRETSRGKEEIELSSLDFIPQYQQKSSSSYNPPITITRNEQLLLEAIQINRSVFQEGQVYPYFYAAHFHKNAGKELGHEEEYRLVEAMHLYSRAAYVASRYPYHIGCMQLNKHMTSAAVLISDDMMTVEEESNGRNNRKKVPRSWHYTANAVAFGTWLVGFYDSLLYWEETSGENTNFVEILNLSHKCFLGKMFVLLAQEVRIQVLAKILEQAEDPSGSDAPEPLIRCVAHGSLSYFGSLRSKRLSTKGLLWAALCKTKVSVPEIAMVISTDGESCDTRSGHRTKRLRR
ncbi:Menin domain family protein [Nitzschia inconspicua]|uniref:Menin n=1 Tax=Nitzschia inconspicua TaxID=303405 RepID=A0A9K3Q409_9STRA|nr:Menin domain family protein [Nitzschia inconspicua]